MIAEGEESQQLLDSTIDDTINDSNSSILRSTLELLDVDSSSDEDNDEMCEEMNRAFSEIEAFKPKKEDVDSDILMYWYERRYTIPYLKQLVYSLHSVPATQVSVERAFSALRLILDDQRCNLSEENLKSIMFVKLNNFN